MVSQSGENSGTDSYLINNLAEVFCKFMDGEEHYPGTPCDACLASATLLAPTVLEELFKPADEGTVVPEWKSPLEPSPVPSIQKFAETVEVAKAITTSDKMPMDYNDLVIEVAKTAKVTEDFAISAVEELLNENILLMDEQNEQFIVYKAD